MTKVSVVHNFGQQRSSMSTGSSYFQLYRTINRWMFRRQQGAHCYSQTTLALHFVMMSIKTIQVMSLPGPQLVDPTDKDKERLLDRAKVAEIFISKNHRVFQGDTIMALEKEGIHKNNIKRELSYVLSPVSGRIVRLLVNAKDYLQVGDPIYEIDTTDEYENPTTIPANSMPLPPPPTTTKRKKVPYLPIPNDILRHYKLLMNEVKHFEKQIQRLRKGAYVPVLDKSLSSSMNTDTLTDKLVTQSTAGSIQQSTNAEKLIYDQLEIYEQILELKVVAYEQTIKTLIASHPREITESDTLQYERINDSDPLDLGSTRKSMGLLYMKLNKYGDNEAYNHMKQAMLIRRKKNRQSNYQHFDLLQDVLVHLGSIQQKRGEFDYARRSLYEAFQLQTRYLGHIQHPLIANTLHILGEIYYDLGQNEEAIQCYASARDMFREIGTTAISKENRIEEIPQIIIADYDFEPATSYEELKFRYKVETAKVLHSMSIVNNQLGNRHLAIDCGIQELRLRKSVLPPHDLSIAKCHYMIGDLLVADGGQQKKDPPINHYTSAISIYEHHYGYYHKTIAMVYISIGALHLKHKKYDDALDNFKKGMEILEKSEGDNLDIASSYFYTGQALLKKGSDCYDDALQYFLRSYSILEETNFTSIAINKNDTDNSEHKGSAHLILQSTIQAIGSIYRDQQKFDEEVKFYKKAVELFIVKIGAKHRDVGSVYFSLAQTLGKQCDHTQALEMFLKAKEIYTSALGDRHPDTALCYYNIGLILRANPSRIMDALGAFKKAYERWLQEYGSEHDDVIAAKKCIDDLETTETTSTLKLVQ